MSVIKKKVTVDKTEIRGAKLTLQELFEDFLELHMDEVDFNGCPIIVNLLDDLKFVKVDGKKVDPRQIKIEWQFDEEYVNNISECV